MTYEDVAATDSVPAGPYYTLSCLPSLGDVAVVRTAVTVHKLLIPQTFLETRRDTIQLENAVSTISQEYVLEFTSEYGMPEILHPELPGPEDPIVEFHEGTVDMDLFSLISAPNPAKVKTETRPHATREVPLLTTTANRVIDMKDMTGASGSSGTPSTVEKSPLDFSNEDPPPLITESGSKCTTQGAEEGSCRLPPLIEYPQREITGFHRNRDGYHCLRTCDQEIPVHTKGVSDPDSLACSRKAIVTEDSDYEKSTSFTSMFGSLGSIYQPGWGVTNNCRLDTPVAFQDMADHIVPPGYFSKLRHLPNDEFLNQYNTPLTWQVAMGSQLRLQFEQETKLLKKAVAQVARRDQRIEAREKHI
nr:hypothetical protein [Tanacetum cinerariifolium]